MVLKILILSFYVTLSGHSHAQVLPIVPTEDGMSCTFYSNLDLVRQCSTGLSNRSNYLRDYGLFFCQKFGPLMEGWGRNDPRTRWSKNVRKCLQNAILPHWRTKSCTQLEKIAFDSHTPCYVKAGFCGLSPFEQTSIVNGINDKRLYEKMKPLLEQGFGVGASCYPRTLVTAIKCITNGLGNCIASGIGSVIKPGRNNGLRSSGKDTPSGAAPSKSVPASSTRR